MGAGQEGKEHTSLSCLYPWALGSAGGMYRLVWGLRVRAEVCLLCVQLTQLPCVGDS